MDDRLNNMAVEQFEKHGGTLSTSDAMRLGIQPHTLYELRDNGVVTRIERGLFRLTKLPPLTHPDLFIIEKKVPKGVICLISALAFYEMTSEIPHEVHVALPRNVKRPRLTHPPIRYFSFSPATYAAGITERLVDDATIKVYSRAKTIADCFRFRNKIGNDVAVSALKHYLDEDRSVYDLVDFAKINRVTTVMRPYMEALL